MHSSANLASGSEKTRHEVEYKRTKERNGVKGTKVGSGGREDTCQIFRSGIGCMLCFDTLGGGVPPLISVASLCMFAQ